MPRERTAYKEIRKARKRHVQNISTKSELKTLFKKFEKSIADKKKDEAKNELSVIVSKISKARTKGALKKNTASRKISRLMKKLAALR